MTVGTAERRYLVDSTAARLSRWLRFLGFDAALDRSKSAARLLVRARREGRVLLTRQRRLDGSYGADVVLLASDHLIDQLKQVVTATGLCVELFPRCTVCNGELEIVPRVDADGRVPEFVYRTQTEFVFCGNCDRYYWKGTHWKNARSTLDSLSAGSAESGEHEQG